MALQNISLIRIGIFSYVTLYDLFIPILIIMIYEDRKVPSRFVFLQVLTFVKSGKSTSKFSHCTIMI